MAVPILTIAKILWSMAPMAKDLLAAIHRDSEGGREITPDELEAIFSTRKVEVRKEVNRRVRTHRRKRKR